MTSEPKLKGPFFGAWEYCNARMNDPELELEGVAAPSIIYAVKDDRQNWLIVCTESGGTIRAVWCFGTTSNTAAFDDYSEAFSCGRSIFDRSISGFKQYREALLAAAQEIETNDK